MARIRTIKPEFFKHGDLQDLEIANPGQYIMLVYAGLWTQCDKNGVFFCKAREVKNAILPYINFDMQKTLDILEKEKYFIKYKSEGREYGFIPNFKKYQYPLKAEKEAPAKYPEPPITENHTENHTEAEGKRIMDKGKRNLSEFPSAKADDQKAIIPVSQEITPKPPRQGKELTEEQKPLFHAVKACFESDPKTKILMYQDKGSTKMHMENIKLFVVRSQNIAPEITADFMRNVLEHFKILINGKLKSKNIAFTPRALITPWIWETVISTLPEADNELTEKIRQSIKGMFK